MPARSGGIVLSATGAVSIIGRRRRGGRTIVFTNGCFDLIHPGHVRLLEKARSLGDLLFVGVNSDRSVRRLKGAGRPIMPLAERMELLAGLRMVDYVVPFDADTPARLVARLQPDVLVKGGDYRKRVIVGREVVEGRGGRVVTVALRAGHSTSELIRRAAATRTARAARRGGARRPR